MIYAQLGGFLIVISGMFFYWFGLGGANVPRDITWRVATLALVMLLSALIPSVWNQRRMIIQGLAGKKHEPVEPWADNPRVVRILVWAYCYADILLLTYLVHVTGGLSGSMYAGVYLMIPAMALILIHNTGDVKIALWLIATAIAGIFLSYLMSRNQWIEFRAAQYDRAFDLSLAIVTGQAIGIPILQVAVLWYQLEGTEGD